MKKLFTLLTMLVVGISGMWAQVVTNRSSAGNPMTFNEFKDLAGKGKHFAIVAPSTNSLTYNRWFSFSKSGYPEMLTTVQLFDLENSATGTGWYNIKRVSDGLFVSTEGGNFDASTKMDFKLVNRRAGDYADEFSNSDLHVSLDNAAGKHYNANTTNLGFRDGTGGFSTYITYGPLYIVTIKCINSATSETICTYQCIAKDKTEITAPNNLGPYTTTDESQTVNGADATFIFNYTPDHSNTKCYNIRNHRGTWAVGSGATVVNSTAELNLAFLSSDVKQQFAFIYYDATNNDTDDGSYYLYSIGESKFAYINGTKLSLTADFTAQVAASPVTFGPSTNSTYNSSAPLVIKFNDKIYGVHTSHSPNVYNYQHDNDEGNATSIEEAGSFDASTATALIDFYYQHTITYVVKDESDNTLFTSDPINIHKGTYNTLPTEYHRDYFYTYATEGVTINDESAANTNLEFVATQKSDILQYTADTSSPIYYNLNIRSKYLVFDNSATGKVKLQDTSTPFNPNAAWAFIGDPYRGFKIINQTNGTDKYLTYTSVVTNRHSSNNIQFVDDSQFNDRYWYFDTNSSGFVLRMKANMDIYFHHDNDKNRNYLRTCSTTEWGSVHNDEGSTLIFASDEEVLQNLYNDLKDVYFADGVGKYTWNGSETTAEEARANINGAGLALDNHVTSLYKDLYDALLYIKDNITLNSVPAGFYRIKGNTSGKYLAAGLASNSKFNMTDATDATTIFYYDGTKLTNLSSGMCNGVTGSTWAWVVGTSASVVTFHDGHTSGGYGIQTSDAYFYDDGDNSSSSANRGANVNMTTDDTRYRSWYLEPVTSLPVTFNKAALGYATFFTPVELKIPENTSAYVCKLDGNKLTFFEITNVLDTDGDRTIPANTAVLLYNSTVKGRNENVVVDFSLTSCEYVISENSFHETLAAEAFDPDDTEKDTYSLRTYTETGAQEATKVGFFKKTSGSYLAGFKAWIQMEHQDNARNLSIYFDGADDPTGIVEALGLEYDNVEIYDLNGRKLSSYKKGINIVNGKKVMVQ